MNKDAFDAANMAEVVKFLQAEIVERLALVRRTSRDLPERLSKRLQQDLETINAKLEKLQKDVLEKNKDVNKDALVRACFSQIGKESRKTFGAFPRSARRRAQVADAHNTPGSVDSLAEFFATLGDFSVELKRFHHDRAANAQVVACAKREAEKIAALNPGVGKNRPLSEIKTNIEGSVGWRAGFLAGIANFGPMATYKFLVERRCYVDEDGKLVLTDSCFHTVRAGLAARLGSMFSATGKGQKIANFFGGGRGFVTTGDYHKYADLESLFKAEISRNADRWSLLFRSGNPDSPGTKFAVTAQRYVNQALEKLTGAKYTFDPGTPMVSQKKMAKGSHNTNRIQQLAAALTTVPPSTRQGQGPKSLRDITALAYPDVSKMLAKRANSLSTAGPEPQNALNVSRPIPAPANAYPSRSRDAIRRAGVAAEVAINGNALDWIHQGHGQLHLVAGANASYEYARHQIALMRLGAPHAQLDPRTTKDIRESERLLSELKTEHQGKPKLHSIRSTEDVLREADRRGSGRTGTPIARMRGEEAALKQIQTQYIELVHLAGVLHGKNDKSGRKEVLAEGEAPFEERFKSFLKNVFGIDGESLKDAKIRKYAARLKAEPNFFMAEAFDALSVSVGQIGVHMFHTKKDMHGKVSDYLANQMQIPDKQKKVDLLYTSVRKMIEEVHMPIDRETLLRTVSVRNKAFSASTTDTKSFDAVVGVYTSPLQYIPGNGTDPSSVANNKHAGPGVRGVAGSVEALVGFSVNSQMRDFQSHAIPIRHGKLSQVRIIGSGKGLPASLLGGVIDTSLEALQRSQMAPNKRVKEKIDPAKASRSSGPVSWVHKAATIVGQATLAEASAEFEYFAEEFQRHDQGDLQYERLRQNVRLSSRKSSAATVVAGVHFVAGGVPMNVWGSASHATSTSNVVCEILGPCPAYHVLVHHQLRSIMAKCKTTAPASKAGGTPPVADFEKMRTLFSSGLPKNRPSPKPPERVSTDKSKDPAVAAAAKKQAEEAKKKLDEELAACDQMNYQLVRFFGSPESILGPLDRFVEYQNTRRRFGGPIVKTKGTRTEYHKWDDNPDLWTTVQTMNESDLFAPGTGTATGNPAGTPKEELDPRPRLTRDEIDAISKVKRFLTSPEHVNMGAVERMEYFFSEKKGAPGPIAFTAYCKIMSQYEKMNDAAKTHHSYFPYVA